MPLIPLPAGIRGHPIYQDLALLKHWRHASLRELRELRRLHIERPAAPGADRVRLRMLGPRPVELRRGTSDVTAAWDVVVGRAHEPPPEVPPTARLILDLGANIGLTMAHYAVLFPNAEIRGVELDAGTAEVARRNVSSFGPRCTVRAGAVWFEQGTVSYQLDTGHEIGAAVAGVGTVQSRTAPALTVASLIGRGETVDFMKVDIEGAEAQLFRRNTSWARQVMALKVEVHEPYSLKECRADLEALGFTVSRYLRHPACLLGLRSESAQ